MQSIRLLSGVLLIVLSAFGMDYPTQQYEAKKKETRERIETLKKALFDKAAPEVIQEIIEPLRSLMSQNYYLWQEVVKFQKAALVGNAESAARVVDLQVQNLARAHKAIPVQLQQEHANARTNVHLVKDLLYPFESGAILRRGGRR